MNKKKLIVISLIIAVILLTGMVFFILRNKDSSSISTYGSTSVNPSANTPLASDRENPGNTTTSKDTSDSSSTPNLSPEVVPAKPSGTFVSNHNPNLSGSPSPNVISSTCTTTPGAFCTIRFINGESTLSLPPQKTNGDGNTTWSWNLNDIDITEGSWRILAVASNSTNEVTSEDAIPLKVSP